MQATLVPHPLNLTGPVESLTVHANRRDGALRVRFVVEGKVDDVTWPETTEGGRADGLWEHTCFEVFVATAEGYREFNLSPSGEWAAYRFDGYREGMSNAAETVRICGIDGGEDRMALEAHIDLPSSPVKLGLSAVIEGTDGAKSYWALTHPADEPDFHHPASFALSIPEPA